MKIDGTRLLVTRKMNADENQKWIQKLWITNSETEKYSRRGSDDTAKTKHVCLRGRC